MNDYTTLQENLHYLRVEARYSQADLAQKLGISRHTYLNYETGIRIPTLEAMRRISEFYNVSIDSMLKESLKK